MANFASSSGMRFSTVRWLSFWVILMPAATSSLHLLRRLVRKGQTSPPFGQHMSKKTCSRSFRAYSLLAWYSLLTICQDV